MERITLYTRTTKDEGEVRLRFRLRDGRAVQLFHKSDLRVDLYTLDKLTPQGTAKPRAIVDPELLSAISKEITAINKVYRELLDEYGDGTRITADTFEDRIAKELHPRRTHGEKAETLLASFLDHIERGERDGLFGEARKANYKVVAKKLERFLTITKRRGILPKDLTGNDVADFRDFIINEYEYVPKWPGLYTGLNDFETPKTRRSNNTAAQYLKMLQAFYTELEDSGVVDKSPFRAMGRERRKAFRAEVYDEPFSLSKGELRQIIDTDVPEGLKETKDAFLLQCATGARVGDFSALSLDKLAVTPEGVPFVHYRPQKTRRTQLTNKETETPLVKFAFDIAKRTQFNFRILRDVYDEGGYNDKVKELLKNCGIDRRVAVSNKERTDNNYLPLYEVATSKLARKTHVNIVKDVQIDRYAARLHAQGSQAVDRYTTDTLHDRFVLLSAAFGEPDFKVNKKLNIINNN